LLAFRQFSLYIRFLGEEAGCEERGNFPSQRILGKEDVFMHTSTTIQPGQRGAKRFVAQYGDRLVCVRYRQDVQRQKRFKTVELIVAEWPWTPPPRRRKESLVFVKVAFSERELRRQIKDVGGVWNPDKQAWEIRYDHAVALGLTPRIMDEAGC
jgi:hypothetical protein